MYFYEITTFNRKHVHSILPFPRIAILKFNTFYYYTRNRFQRYYTNKYILTLFSYKRISFHSGFNQKIDRVKSSCRAILSPKVVDIEKYFYISQLCTSLISITVEHLKIKSHFDIKRNNI